jgi:hypothetical protein
MSAKIIKFGPRLVAEAPTAPVKWELTMHGQVWEFFIRAAAHIEARQLTEAERLGGFALGLLGRMKVEGITTLEDDERRHRLFRRKMQAVDKARATRARNKAARLAAAQKGGTP